MRCSERSLKRLCLSKIICSQPQRYFRPSGSFRKELLNFGAVPSPPRPPPLHPTSPYLRHPPPLQPLPPPPPLRRDSRPQMQGVAITETRMQVKCAVHQMPSRWCVVKWRGFPHGNFGLHWLKLHVAHTAFSSSFCLRQFPRSGFVF